MLALLCLSLLCSSACVHLDLAEEVNLTPPVPNWSDYFTKLPKLNRRLQIASPCVGIHGCGHACLAMDVGADSINVFDLQPGYRQCLYQHLQDMGMGFDTIKLHLGENVGNVLKHSLQNLQIPVDFLIAGPPCPPWAGQGNKNGLHDPRAAVFLRILEWLVYFIKCAGLLGCILENVLGITHEHAGREPVIRRFLEVLRQYCPEFDWTVDVLRAVDYCLPQSRVRVFLRGLRKFVAMSIPKPLAAFGRRHIRDILGKFPHTTRSELTLTQQDNLLDFENKIVNMVSAGTLDMSDVVVVPVDRADGKVYKQHISVNCLPTLTTHNVYLFVLSVADVVNEVPDEEREFCRKVMAAERLTSQGFPAELLFGLGRELATFAAGNAYPVPLIIAALHPILEAIGNCDVLATWPPQDMVSKTLPACLGQAMEAFKRPGRLTAKVKQRAKLAKRKRKRAHSDGSDDH